MVANQLTGGYLFDIQGFSVHDGPGCRTLIFFKGCPMRCEWCSNPEGISGFPEPLYNPSKCTMDLLCMEACPYKAISVSEQALLINRNICNSCTLSACMDSCCTGAIRKAGYYITTPDLYKKIQRDRQYWGLNGGITLTGGEPFMQPEFAQSLLKKCFVSFIHTSIETCGNVPWKNISSSLEWLEWIFFDLKHIDSKKHKQATGVSNNLILKNAKLVAEQFKGRLIFRIPLIPGFNDDEISLTRLTEFILSTGKKEVNIIPVHHMGREKYNLLGINYYTTEFTISSSEELLRASRYFTEAGLTCYLGSDTPF
jgi:pyruvate formate lyase activating enzyme